PGGHCTSLSKSNSQRRTGGPATVNENNHFQFIILASFGSRRGIFEVLGARRRLGKLGNLPYSSFDQAPGTKHSLFVRSEKKSGERFLTLFIFLAVITVQLIILRVKT
ncbi:hypothetical protein M8C21_027440, partial [Ambrosia artemisiifolia]